MLFSDEIKRIHIFLDFLMSGICPCASSPLNQTLSPMIQPPTSIQRMYDIDNTPTKNQNIFCNLITRIIVE